MKRRLLLSLLLILMCAAVFIRSVGNDFVNLDDQQYITSNPQVRQGLNLNAIRWAGTTFRSANWHPLTWFSHLLDVQVFGLQPGGHHFTSLLLHTLSSLLLLLLFQSMTGAAWPSFMVAALFAVHPLHVESVAWVAERKDVLSGLFFMLTLLAYQRYARRPGRAAYLTVLLLFALGLMSKPMLVTLPFVLLLLDWWPLGRFPGRSAAGKLWPFQPASPISLLLEKAPLLALSTASAIVTYLAQHEWKAIFTMQHLPLPARVANGLVSYCRYLMKTVWPARLSVFYPHPGGSIPWTWTAGAALFLIAATFLALRERHRRPWLAVGWLWYLGTLVPVIGLVQVGNQAMADRYTYLPLIGIFIIAAWGGAQLAGRLTRAHGVAPGIAGGVLATLMVLSWVQVGHWRNGLTLFTHAARVTRGNWLAHANLGNEYSRAGDYSRALEEYRLTLRASPRIPDVHYWMGLAWSNLGDATRAIEAYRHALLIKPDYPEVHHSLGLLLAKRGELDQAIEHYRKALKLKPEFPDALISLGVALDSRGETSRARSLYEQALRLRPDDAQAHFNLGTNLGKEGRADDAARHYIEAIALKPDFPEAHNNLGNILFREGKYTEAIPHYREALRVTPGDLEIRSNLLRAQGMVGGGH